MRLPLCLAIRSLSRNADGPANWRGRRISKTCRLPRGVGGTWSQFSLVLRHQRATDLVAHEAGLLVAIDLEREARDDLIPASAEVVDVDRLRAGAHLAACRDRCREADLVPAVVDAEDEARRLDQLLAEAVDQPEREV